MSTVRAISNIEADYPGALPIEKARLRIVESLDELPASQWRTLVTGRPALCLEVLKAVKISAATPFLQRIFLLEDENGLAAAGICEPITQSGSHNSVDALLFGRAMRLARAVGATTHPVLLFRTPIGSEPAVVVRSGSQEERQHLLRTLLDAIEEHAARHKFAVAFLGVSEQDQLLSKELAARHFLDTQMQPMAQLDIEWTDFDGYLHHLRSRSKNSARSARLECNRNRKAGISIRQIVCKPSDAEFLYKLARDHYRMKNGRELFVGSQCLPELHRTLGNDLLVFEAVRDEQQRVAMLGIVRSGDVGWMAWMGFADNDRPNDFTYANLCYYHPAAVASSLGMKTLLYGNLALDAKLRRGCRIVASHLFYRPHHRIFRFIAQPYFAFHRRWYRRKLG